VLPDPTSRLTLQVRDLDLLNPMRELIHKGKVFRQPESTIGSGSWSELLILLFDNYCTLPGETRTDECSRPRKAYQS
jgi:hypothetical protein